MRQPFKDQNHNIGFADNGYIIAEQLLDDASIRVFEEFYQSIPPASADTFYSSHWNDDKAYRKKVDAFIRPILFEKVQSLFESYRPVYGYFLVKMPGEKGTVSVHQDWMLVDESKFHGITVWIPLVDTTLENGSFQIVENSHKFLSQIRGSNTHFPYRSDLDKVHQTFLTNINLKKGDALIFDHKLAHASLPNKTVLPRVAVGLVLLPQEAPFIHYYFNPQKKDKQLSLYEVDDNFLLDFGLRDSPEKYKCLKQMDFTNPILPLENLATSYEIHKGI